MILNRKQVEIAKSCPVMSCDNCKLYKDKYALDSCMLDSDLIETLETAWKEVDKYKTDNKPRPLVEWGEDYRDCLWWKFPIEEPPYCGSPLDSSFPDYVTHFTMFQEPEKEDDAE